MDKAENTAAASGYPSPDKALASIFISGVNTLPVHCHSTYELIFMLDGSLNVSFEGKTFKASKGDLILINRLAAHSFGPCGSCVHLVCQLDIAHMMESRSLPMPLFSVNSVEAPSADYSRLRQLLARLVEVQAFEDYNIASRGMICLLLSELLRSHLAAGSTASVISSDRLESRQLELVNYISDHYRENLTLSHLADTFSLSVPYLSSFFKKNIGITFTQYYNTIRLDRATNEMLSTDLSIEEIAINNGFSDSRAFSKLFQERYSMRPSVYRRAVKGSNPFPKAQSQRGNLFHPSLPASVYEPLLAPYRAGAENGDSPDRSAAADSAYPPVQYESLGTVFMDPRTDRRINRVEKVCFINHFQELLSSHIQQMFARLQRTVSFDYAALDIISYLDESDPSIVISELSFDFYFIDLILDFLNSINLKPMFTIRLGIDHHFENACSDTPDSQKIVFPAGPELAAGRLNSLASHIARHYGASYTENCRFRLWLDLSEYDIPITNAQEYYSFYRLFFNAVKRASPGFEIISHTIAFGNEAIRDFHEEYAAFCLSNGCVPDVFQFAYQRRDYTRREQPVMWTPAYIQEKVHSFQTACHIEHIPYCLMEFDVQLLHTNPINDTCFRSCYIMHLLIQSAGVPNLTGLWKLSDYVMDEPFPASLFHGGIGLYTYNGIAKPFLHAISFLDRLEDNIMELDDGLIVTQDDACRRIVIIIYNYEFYRHAQDVKKSPGVSPFMSLSRRSCILKLEHVGGYYYTMKQYSICEQHGSAYDAWTSLGSRQELSETSLDYLRRTGTELSVSNGKINNSIINLHAELDPLEIRLIEIEVCD